MKLLRFHTEGGIRPGILDSAGALRDLSDHVADIDGATLSPDALDRLRGLDASRLPRVEGNPRLAPCVGGVGKVMCIGLNYSDHAAEAGMAVPEHPILFEGNLGPGRGGRSDRAAAWVQPHRLGGRTGRGDRPAGEICQP